MLCLSYEPFVIDSVPFNDSNDSNIIRITAKCINEMHRMTFDRVEVYIHMYNRSLSSQCKKTSNNVQNKIYQGDITSIAQLLTYFYIDNVCTFTITLNNNKNQRDRFFF